MNELMSEMKIEYPASSYGSAGKGNGFTLKEKSIFPKYTTFTDYLVNMLE